LKSILIKCNRKTFELAHYNAYNICLSSHVVYQDMKENLITTGSNNEILEHLHQTEYGTHSILVYPNVETLRETYSRYVKSQLEDNNEIVLILPYYETANKVRKTLSEGFANNIADGNGNDANSNDTNGNSIIDMGKYEKEGSLIIMDSVKGYFGSDNNYNNTDLTEFVKQLVKKAESTGKNGVSVFADLGSFYHYHHSKTADKLVEYELSLPSKFDGMKLKAFCIYHKEDINKRFTEEQKQKLLDHHAKALMIAN
jgi:MEDS: MEthanogen/methylotroph, DcmR Sensory domain